MLGFDYIDNCRYNTSMDKIFKALADKNRRKILTLLKNGEFSVNDLLKGFDITQATLSNHLSVLKRANLIESRVVGKQRIYSIKHEILQAFAENISKFAGSLDKSFVDEIEIRSRK